MLTKSISKDFNIEYSIFWGIYAFDNLLLRPLFWEIITKGNIILCWINRFRSNKIGVRIGFRMNLFEILWEWEYWRMKMGFIYFKKIDKHIILNIIKVEWGKEYNINNIVN